MRRRRFLVTGGTAFFTGIAGCARTSGQSAANFNASSPAFSTNSELPTRFTCDGAGISPPLVVENIPKPTAALAVALEYDRGVINEPVLWTLWNVPTQNRIPADIPRTATVDSLDGARQGRRPGQPPGYDPPCPPAGKVYEHRFQVHALSEKLPVKGGATHDTARDAIGNNVLASSRITVTYTRSAETTEQE
ncbi:YbhB/YbcL family Raf kinase inhibitor-like protein [Haloarcula amylovorans]|uniref:YbhB/YbcL family Raf kinase inhibitor-like protein n=1 Tax=Haloarcula amylovorans TaxID=2562280 RepID=UPI001076140E|nr:YbhB/YbcL family Raf kinase inhibitor-like protein [Halomicroarcula amylolytica]